MKKYIFLFFSGLFLSLSITYLLNCNEAAFEKPNAYTPAELHEQRLAAKREKRAKGIYKADSPDEFAKLHFQIRTKEGDDAPQYGQDYVINELKKAKNKAARFRIQSPSYVSEWTSRGPSNVPGRTRGLLVHPSDPLNTWLAGSVGGGVWKTTDRGQSWTNLTPEITNLATTALAMSPANPDIIYAGTGEGFFSVTFINGSGIYKTTDGGLSWNRLASTANHPDFKNVNRIIVDPANPNLLLACTNSGFYNTGRASAIMRSTDGGQSWTKVYNNNFPKIQQLVFTPGNFDVQYAALDGFGVLKSIDAGITWTNASSGLNINGRIEIAVAPTNPDRLYASAEGGLYPAELYVSDDAASTWNIVLQDDGSAERDYLGGQGWYDNTIAVSPYNQDKVYFGGVNLWLATMKQGTSILKEVTSVSETYESNDYIEFQAFNATYYNGRLEAGPISSSRWANVEIRVGNGLSQKAHRFTVPIGGGSDGDDGAGVPDSDYIYEDYVDVPFQVWDTDQNRQLMVSFRDQERDGTFDLEQESDIDGTVAREYIFIHDITYAATADSRIDQNGGQVNDRMFFMWPRLASGATWNPAAQPEATIKIFVSELNARLASTEDVSDAYGQFSGQNRFSQTTGSETQEGLHPDHHNLIMVKTDDLNQKFFILNANDGGVYYSKTSDKPGVNEGDWIFAGNGYGTSQFYGVAKRRGYDEYIGGMQDNGTWRSPVAATADTRYIRQIGGDGFEAIWHYEDPNKIIGSWQYNNFMRSLDGGETWSVATNGLTDINADGGIFISNLDGSTTNPDVIYTLGTSGVWKSTDFGANWNLTPINSGWSYTTNNPDIKVSLANDQVIWAGFGMANNNKIHLSTDGGASFNSVNNYSQTLGSITGLATHPFDEGTAYALFSFAKSPKILRTTDYGQTWTDISGFASTDVSNRGFPDVAVHSLLVMPHDPNIIWVGTEIGLIESTDNGATWNWLPNSVPATAIWNMHMTDDQVVMATHGRGIWTATIPQTPRQIAPPQIIASGVTFDSSLIIKADLKEVYDSTRVLLNNEVIDVLPRMDRGTVFVSVSNLEEGIVTVELVAYEGGTAYTSAEKQVYYFEPNAPVQYYENDFDDNINDFAGFGYNIEQPNGFSNNALHSARPYQDQQEIVYTLRYPIIIDGVKNKILFNEIALIEPGEPDADFGTEDFNDYVIVEASDNGYEWKQLGNGYDANLFSEWTVAYADESQVSESLFKVREYTLKNLFTPGDTVFIRFRLSSNLTGNGWGWAIDDLLIQDPVLGIEAKKKQENLPLKIYPNPVEVITHVQYQLGKSTMVNYRIIDNHARIVKEQIIGMQPPGNREIEINTADLSTGTYYFILYTNAGFKAIKFMK